MKLNQQQKEAVIHLDGPCLVTSCPGSGKTRVLVERVIFLLKAGIPSNNILCITFTNKAANEMRERVCKRLQVDKPGLFMGTFHALCAKLLRKIGDRRGYKSNFNILDDRDQYDLIMQIARQMGLEIDRSKGYLILNAVNNYRDQLEDFSVVSERLVDSDDLRVAEVYLERCRQNNLIDFSGLIYETIKIIEENDDILEKVQTVFKYIMVDETQDTNNSQYHLVNLFGGKWRNIMLIGDTDQSIYGWRNARCENLNEFLVRYPECRHITLSKNYRSTPQIISHAKKLIKHNDSHMDVTFETDNPDGEPVRCYDMSDQNREAYFVANRINRLVEEAGWDPGDVAVLYRMNKMSEPFERAFTTTNIPYEVVGSWNFYDRKEVKDCLALLKFLVNKKDGIAFHRVCSFVKGLGDVTVGKIENLALQKDIDLVQAGHEIKEETNSSSIKKALGHICNIYDDRHDQEKPSDCMTTLVKEFNVEGSLGKKYGAQESEERLDNVRQIIETSSMYDGRENGCETYLQQISLVTSSDKETDAGKVSLMTLHTAKGLEFPIVFMVGVEYNILPHGRCLSEDFDSGLEEERRLCYVGMTRAKNILYMTWCKFRKKFGRNGAMFDIRSNPSRFLKEAGLME